jgi:hypothetical protein
MRPRFAASACSPPGLRRSVEPDCLPRPPRRRRVRLGICSSLAALILATAAPALAQDPAKIEQAKKHMQAGAAFYNDPSGHKCEEALREFGKAYELSGSLNALKGMAVCNLELERDGEAIEQFAAYLKGKGDKIEAADKQQVESDLNALRAAVVKITITVDRPNVKITDVRTPSRGYPITNVYQVGIQGKKLGIHPGAHTFTASAEGSPDLVWKIDLSNGGTYDHAFEFEKAGAGAPPSTPGDAGAQTSRPISIPVWIAAGTTVALTGVTVGMMVRANGIASNYNDQNGRAPRSVLEPLRDDVNNANLLADIFLGASVAGLATTVVLFVLRPTKQVEAPKSAWISAPTLTVGPAGAGASWTGAF